MALLAIATSGFPTAMVALTWVDDVLSKRRGPRKKKR